MINHVILLKTQPIHGDKEPFVMLDWGYTRTLVDMKGESPLIRRPRGTGNVGMF